MSWAEDEGYDGWYDEDMHPFIDFTRGEWYDKDGKRHIIKNMGWRHIENCIKMLTSTKDKWDYPPYDLKEINKKIAEFKKELATRHNFKGEKF